MKQRSGPRRRCAIVGLVVLAYAFTTTTAQQGAGFHSSTAHTEDVNIQEEEWHGHDPPNSIHDLLRLPSHHPAHLHEYKAPYHDPDLSLLELMEDAPPAQKMASMSDAFSTSVGKMLQIIAEEEGVSDALNSLVYSPHHNLGSTSTHPSLLIDVAAAASVDIELEIAQRASGALIKSALRSLRSGTGRKDSDKKCNPRDLRLKVARQSMVEEASEGLGAEATAEAHILQDKFSDMLSTPVSSDIKAIEKASTAGRVKKIRAANREKMAISLLQACEALLDRLTREKTQYIATLADASKAPLTLQHIFEGLPNIMTSDTFTKTYEKMEVLAKMEGRGRKIYDKLIVVVEDQIRLAKATVGNHILPVVTSEERAAEDRESASAETCEPASSFMCEAKGVISETWQRLSKRGPKIKEFFLALKLAVFWGLPIAPSPNPALPGIAVNCQPLALCLKLISGATKALLGAVYDVTKAVGKLIWLALKTVLSKILDIGKFATKLASKYAPALVNKAGSAIASLASSTMKSVSSLVSNAVSSVKGTAESLNKQVTSIGKTENLGWQSEFVQKDDPPYLVSQGDSGDRAREECQPCNLRLKFIFAPRLLDVMVAFNPITTFKIVLTSLPQTSPTLFKCGKACLRFVWSTIVDGMKRLNKKKYFLQKYWQQTCSPHSVGMCMMLGRVRQCGDDWSTLPEAHVLRQLSALNTKNTLTGPLVGSALCSTFPENAQITVGKNAAGDLICPADSNEFTGSQTCFPNKPQDSVSGALQCATMSLKEGCLETNKIMHKLETNQPDQCMFKDTQLQEPTHSNLLRRCLGLMNCYDPADRDIEDQLLVAATPLTTDVLMHSIRKHMDSMDYLGHQNGKPLVSAESAGRALEAELKSLMRQSEIMKDGSIDSSVECKHQWKRSSNYVFRHNLWTGKCIDWGQETRQPLSDAVFLEGGGIFPQKKASSMLRKPQKDAEGKSDSMFARPASLFASAKMTKGQVAPEVTPITMEKLVGPTDISWQEAVNEHLANAWKSKSIQDKLPDYLMNGAQFDDNPDRPKFRTGDGEIVQQMNGQVFNRMILLADAIGVSTSNQKRCACLCCRTKMRTSAAPGVDVCTRVLVGSLWDISEEECKSEVCEEAYPGECPSQSQVAQRTGLISAKFVRRQADPKAKFNDVLGMSISCKQSAERLLQLSDRSQGDIFQKHVAYWAEQNAKDMSSVMSCDGRIAAADQNVLLGKAKEEFPGIDVYGSAEMYVDHEAGEVRLSRNEKGDAIIGLFGHGEAWPQEIAAGGKVAVIIPRTKRSQRRGARLLIMTIDEIRKSTGSKEAGMVDLVSRNGLQKLAGNEGKDIDYSQGHVVVKVLLMPTHGKWPHMRPAPEGSLMEPTALDEPASVSDATAKRGEGVRSPAAIEDTVIPKH